MASTQPSRTTGPVAAALTGATQIAIAVALLQWAGVVVFRIPSPSMQPTVLGSDDAHDRVLVDTLRYRFADPARWDLVAFHPPQQRRDTWLKRCVGLPGERIAIAGGNLYCVHGDAAALQYTVLRRPADLQRTMWREVHPARALARGESRWLGRAFTAVPAADWSEPDPTHLDVHLRPGIAARLRWTDPDGGLVDRPWDGCPPALASAQRAAIGNASLRGELVVDARVDLRLDGVAALRACRLALDVTRPGLPRRRFALELEPTALRVLVAEGADAAIVAASPRMPLHRAAAGAMAIAFEHLDDELIASVDGGNALRLDIGAFACRDGGTLPDPCGAGPAMPTPEQQVLLTLEFEGDGALGIDDLRIWRDQHWSCGAEPESTSIDLPADHYLVLGDNPHASTDGRGFATVELDVRDGVVVPPDATTTQHLVGARMLVANGLPPQPGENPVCCTRRGMLAFTTSAGSVRALTAPLVDDPVTGLPCLRWPDGRQQEFVGPSIHGIARDQLVGRAVARCWPPWPGWLH